jgi:hypothetical protein
VTIIVFSNYEGSDLILFITSRYSAISQLLTPLKFSPSTHQQGAPDQNCFSPQKPIHASRHLLSTFSLRNIDALNALSASLRPTSSLHAFKGCLKQYNLSFLNNQLVTEQSVIISILKLFIWFFFQQLSLVYVYCVVNLLVYYLILP